MLLALLCYLGLPGSLSQAKAQANLSAGIALTEQGNYAAARDVFTVLAANGDALAMYHLGALQHSGLLGAIDLDQAVRWYTRASDSGVAEAQFALGALHYKGKGVREDLALALDLFTRAANAGLVSAQYNLAVMHASGLAHTKEYGAQEDRPRAYKWYNIVLTQIDDAKERDVIEWNLAFLRKEMDADEVARGDELLAEWRSHHTRSGRE